MKKLKILFIIIMILSSFSLTLPTLSYAEDLDPQDYKPSDQGIDNDAVAKYTGPIYNVLYGVAIVISVITLMIIGLKFIVGSAQEKAEYKQHLIPVVVGICIIVFLLVIIGVFGSLGSSIENTVTQKTVEEDDPDFIGPKRLDME